MGEPGRKWIPKELKSIIRKLSKVNQKGVSLKSYFPINMVRDLGWEEGDFVKYTKKGNKIVVEKVDKNEFKKIIK